MYRENKRGESCRYPKERGDEAVNAGRKNNQIEISDIDNKALSDTGRYRTMSGEKKKREAVFTVRPGESQSVEEFADDLTEALIEQVNEERKKRGLPPLPEE